MDAPKNNQELEYRVIKVFSEPWSNKDGLHNIGNIARKVGTSTSELSRTMNKLEKEGRISR